MKKAYTFITKIVAIISAIAILTSTLIIGMVGSAQAETPITESEAWTGDVAETYNSGSGTETNPYMIATAEQLAKMVQDTQSSGKYYKLECNIVINDTSNENWKDTAKQWIWNNNIFQGNFNGDGYTIKGLYYNGEKSKVGLFCYTKNATIKRVIMDGVYVHSSGYATGSIVGDANSGTLTLQECYVINADIKSTYNTGGDPGAGGLIGYGGATINVKDSAFVSGTVSAPKNAGSILGNCWSTKVVKNTFSNLDMNFCTKQDLSTGSANNYGVGSYTRTGVTFLSSADKMIGEAAKTNMPNLDWSRYWKTTSSGYPQMKLQGTMSQPGDVWTGNVATDYAGGEGTEKNPYLISTGEHLAKLSLDKNTKGKYYKLTHDIILNDATLNNWKTYAENWICSTSATFEGTLDGNGFTISGLYYNGASNFVALFSYIDTNAKFKNVFIDNASVTTTGDGAGIFAGQIKTTGTAKFDHCYIGGNVEVTGREGAGGFVAYGTCASISFNACASFAKATATYRRAGSFLGNIYYNSGTARTITVNGCIAGTAYSNYYIGNDSSFTNSYCATSEAPSEITAGVINVVSLSNMKGENAKTSMPKLDWIRTWKADKNGGYPRPIVVDPNGTAGEVWSGNIATQFAGGKGTEEDPYLIATGEQLAKMVTTPTDDSKGKFYKLVADIKLNDTTIDSWKDYAINWVLNDNTSKFSGTLDGDGHKITGLYYKGSANLVALAKYADNATFKRIWMSDLYVNTSGYAPASFVGIASGTIKLVECYVDETAEISSTDETSNAGAAGFVGYGDGGVVIEDSAYLGTVDAPKNEGTFLGNLWKTGDSAYIIKNSFSIQNIKFFGKSDRSLGSNSENNYGTGSVAETGVNIVTAAEMKGKDVKTNMPKLDWGRTWAVNNDGYPLPIFPDPNGTAGEVWTGNIAVKYNGGDGTKSNPYQIATAEQFAKMINDTESEGKYYKLTYDIKLNDTSKKNWKEDARPWYWTNTFKGNFNGDGYVISGAYYDGNKNNIGLFNLTVDAVIRRVILRDSYFRSEGYAVGGIVGQATKGKTTIKECYVEDTVEIESTFNADNNLGAGGIVGYGGAEISVSGTAFLGSVKAERFAGSILGNCWGTISINNCFSSADVRFCSKQSLSNDTSDNNYSACTEKENSVVCVTLEEMKGDTAIENMDGLDWGRIWKTTEDGFPVCKFAEDTGSTGDIWSGAIAETYAGGSGTKEDPYLISNGEQLALMVTDTDSEGKYYKITADIKLNDTSIKNWRYYAKQWVWSKNVFAGNVDGAGHKITGLYYNGAKSKVGLFAYAANAVINSLVIDEAYLHSTGYGVGAIIGDANRDTVAVNECYVGEKVDIKSTYALGDNAGAGGIIGYGGAAITVRNSAFLGKVDAPLNAGAILGNCWAKDEAGNSGLRIFNSYSTSEIRLCVKQSLNYESDNNYSASTDEEIGVVSIDVSKMSGKTASENMPKLDWGRFWKVDDEGYPVCRFGDVVETPDGVWSGKTAKEYANGSGTKEDPYLISNGEELRLMVTDTDTKDKYYKLTEDIKLNDTTDSDWIMTAKQWNWNENKFSGNVDGDGHKITGIYYNGTRSKVGLFCYAIDATIENIVLDDVYIHSIGFAVGSLVGDASSGLVTLKQCYVGEDVNLTSTYDVDDNTGAGGIVGYGGAAITVEGSAFLGKVSAPKNVGAILGNCWGKDENGSSAILIRHSFTTANLRLCTKQSLNYASDSNYSVSTEEEIGVVSVELSKMKGEDANTNMPKLDWGRFWKVNDDSYPTCRFGEIDVVSGIWSGDVATEYAGGSGTEEDPYLISNGEELRLMVTDTDTIGKYYKLTADIKLNDTTDSNWIKTAKQWDWNENKFSGNIDGDGHKITGLYYNGTRSKAGLICYAIDASISNITIDDSYISSLGYAVSSIVGDANTGYISLNRCLVGENVYLESEFNADSNAGAGGLVGYGGAAVSVTASAFLGEVKAPMNAGSIFGNCWGKDETGASALIVKYSYSPSTLPFCSKQALSYASDNNYSANNEEQTGVIFIEAEKMIGKDAIENMPALDWGRYWQITEFGYPICKIDDLENPENIWSGEVATEYSGGSGTKEDPYLITNGEELALMVLDTESEGKYYKQTTDIYLNDITKENWKSTAKQWIWTNNIFKGTFDGDTNSIRGLYYNGTKSKIGLFCYVANATIKRVVLDDLYVLSTGYAVGAIVGDANHGTVLISECYVAENSYVESTFNKDNNVGAGGIVGYGGAEVTIYGSAFLGEVKAPENLGAMLGNCWTAAIVKNSFATPSIKYCTKRDISSESSANYGTGKETENGVISISANQMKGERARKIMKNLNWFRSWKTTEDGYPVLNVGEYEGVEGEVWTGRLATKFAGGSGTEQDPYLISTGEQLAYLLDNIMSSKGNHYKLTSDIYLNDINNPNWEKENPRPWFYASTARFGNFNGHFNGDGHVIHGLYLDVEQTSSVLYTGLFPTTSDGTVVEKTGLSNAHIKATTDNYEWQSYVGGFTGVVFFNQSDEETDINNLTRFSQCFGDSTVVLEGRYVGGIVSGGPRPANIDNCYFIGKVIGERVGAIIGNTWTDFEAGTVTKSYGATMEEDIFCGGKSGVQNSATPITYVNNYTNATGSVNGHATQIGLLMMRGASAKKNMPALDFKNIWHALENGTPVLKIFGTTDKYSNTSDPEPIEISFVSNGGTPCENMYGNPEEKLTLPIPTKEGYKFGGWYVYRELDIEYSIDYFPYFDQILYAKWIPLGIIQNFESYPNTMYDLGWDYEYYRPGTVGYDARNVHGGMASMHRIGLDDYHSDVLMNYEEMLTVGKKYNVTFWITTDTQDTSVKLSLVHEKWPDVYTSDLGVETIKELTNMNQGEWQKVEYTFIARTKWIAIRTSGGASVYIDDFMAIADSDKIYPVEDLPVEETPEETPTGPSDTSSDSSQENTSSEVPSVPSNTSSENTSSDTQSNTSNEGTSSENTSSDVSSAPSDTSSDNSSGEVSSTPSDTSSENSSSEVPSVPSDTPIENIPNDNQGENIPSLPPENFFGDTGMEIPIIDDPTLNVPGIENMNSQESTINNGILVIMPEENEPKKVIKKRIWKKRRPSTKKNNDLVWFVGGASVLVVLLGATLYAIFYMKKRKFRKR